MNVLSQDFSGVPQDFCKVLARFLGAVREGPAEDSRVLDDRLRLLQLHLNSCDDRRRDVVRYWPILVVESESFHEISLSLFDRPPLTRHLDLQTSSYVPPVFTTDSRSETHLTSLPAAPVLCF